MENKWSNLKTNSNDSKTTNHLYVRLYMNHFIQLRWQIAQSKFGLPLISYSAKEFNNRGMFYNIRAAIFRSFVVL
jgi:hypothetical protein